jgi:CubicO group peptidase (beta-lactamase class C family)
MAGDDGAVVHGLCERGFERVREALAAILVSGSEVGAALAVYVDARAVVDLWGGHTDGARTRPWARDTIVNLYSIGKAVSAVCALRLVEAGLLDLDAPVARYWPEFARAGKAQIPVRYLLTHQAALPAIARPLPSGAWSHWDVMTGALAAQAPWWEPGTGHGYHVNTQGFLIGEVAAEVPSTNGHGNARAVARLYSALAALGFADTDARIAFGYATNQGRGGWQHKHVRHLIDLVYAAL